MSSMKGIVHKVENGWTVWYHSKEDLYYGSVGTRVLPLDPESIAGIFIQDTDQLYEGMEVDFEIIKYPNPPHNPTYHSVDIAARLVSSKQPFGEVKMICPSCKTLIPCSCNSSWDTILKEFYLAEQQVPIGAPPLIFECWLVENYEPPKKKV